MATLAKFGEANASIGDDFTDANGVVWVIDGIVNAALGIYSWEQTPAGNSSPPPKTPDPTPSKIILTKDNLVVGVNCATDLDAAIFSATITPKMSGFVSLSEHDQVAQIMGAWEKIKLMNFCVDDFTWTDSSGDTRCDIDLENMGAAAFALLPDAFKSAMVAATVITGVSEAKCDSSEMQREDGVLSSKQGDYTITYKSGSPMRFPIPRAAVDRLAKYLCSGKGLARAS